MLHENTRPHHDSTCVTSRGVGDVRQGEERVFVIGEHTHICGLTTLCSRATAPTPPMLIIIPSGDRRDSRRRLLPRWPRSLPLCAERLCAHTGAGASAATRMRAGRMGARVWREGALVARPVRSSSTVPLGTLRVRRRGIAVDNGWVECAFLKVPTRRPIIGMIVPNGLVSRPPRPRRLLEIEPTRMDFLT